MLQFTGCKVNSSFFKGDSSSKVCLPSEKGVKFERLLPLIVVGRWVRDGGWERANTFLLAEIPSEGGVMQ